MTLQTPESTPDASTQTPGPTTDPTQAPALVASQPLPSSEPPIHFLPSSQPESPTPPTSSGSPSSPADPSTSPITSDPQADDASASAAPSTGGKTTGKPSAAELADFVQEGVGIITGIVHAILTKDGTLEREMGVWVADAEDLVKIGDPLASIAARKLPAGIADASNADKGRLVMALGSYVIKNVRRLRSLRAAAPAATEEPAA